MSTSSTKPSRFHRDSYKKVGWTPTVPLRMLSYTSWDSRRPLLQSSLAIDSEHIRQGRVVRLP